VTARPRRIPGQQPHEWSDDTRAHLDAVVQTVPGAPSKPVHLPAVIAHHPTFLGPYLEWAKAIALRGVLPARANAILALRTAWHRRSAFEWGVHANGAIARGLLTAGEVAALAVPEGASDEAWDRPDALLLRAADDLCTTDTIDDDTWAALAGHHPPDALLEIVFVVGHYTMLSMVANAAGVPVEPGWPDLPASHDPPAPPA
jgi:4-carboxymuconolactone decarboxylase